MGKNYGKSLIWGKVQNPQKSGNLNKNPSPCALGSARTQAALENPHQNRFKKPASLSKHLPDQNRSPWPFIYITLIDNFNASITSYICFLQTHVLNGFGSLLIL